MNKGILAMPRISMWKPNKDNDYYFIDRALYDNMFQGGTGVHTHKYIGPSEGSDLLDIDDVLFLENRSRKYDDIIYELKGVYQPSDSDFDLSQFGIFLQNDTIYMIFHYTTMIKEYGRKIISGDVLELPHLRDPDLLDEDADALNRFYVVQDSYHDANGYDPKWRSHLWKVKAKQIQTASEEFSDIIGPTPGQLTDADGDPIDGGSGCIADPSCLGDQTTYCKELELTDRIVEEAEKDVLYDPIWFEARNAWVAELEDGRFDVYPASGDNLPPNGNLLYGTGDEFPEDIEEGEFFIRTDYSPDRMFRKRGNTFIKIEDDIRKKWTAYGKQLDTFIDNDDKSTLADGSTIKVRQPISKMLKPKLD